MRQSRTSGSVGGEGRQLPSSTRLLFDLRGVVVSMRSLVGQPAVTFNLSDAEGRTHRLDDYRGAWLLMVFHRHLG